MINICHSGLAFGLLHSAMLNKLFLAKLLSCFCLFGGLKKKVPGHELQGCREIHMPVHICPECKPGVMQRAFMGMALSNELAPFAEEETRASWARNIVLGLLWATAGASLSFLIGLLPVAPPLQAPPRPARAAARPSSANHPRRASVRLASPAPAGTPLAHSAAGVRRLGKAALG